LNVLRAFGAIHRVRIPDIDYPNEKELSASPTVHLKQFVVAAHDSGRLAIFCPSAGASRYEGDDGSAVHALNAPASAFR
jgi:hypothetical protein